MSVYPPEAIGAIARDPEHPDTSVWDWQGWRGKKTKGGTTLWQTEQCWGKAIADLPGEQGGAGQSGENGDWHVTRRDACVDLETAQLPEQWWVEWFGGTRGMARDADGNKVGWPGGTQGGHSNAKGNTVEVGSRRGAAFLRIYTKFLRTHVNVDVRQEHFDAWAAAGWNGGMVIRCEFECKLPGRLDGTIAEVWADAAARIRLLEHPPRGRASDVATAQRWVDLTEPVKRLRQRPAPALRELKLTRAIERLRKLYTESEIALAMTGAGPLELRDILGRKK